MLHRLLRKPWLIFPIHWSVFNFFDTSLFLFFTKIVLFCVSVRHHACQSPNKYNLLIYVFSFRFTWFRFLVVYYFIHWILWLNTSQYLILSNSLWVVFVLGPRVRSVARRLLPRQHRRFRSGSRGICAAATWAWPSGRYWCRRRRWARSIATPGPGTNWNERALESRRSGAHLFAGSLANSKSFGSWDVRLWLDANIIPHY